MPAPLDRRAFLKATTALAAAASGASLIRPAPAQAGPLKGKVKTAVRYNMVTGNLPDVDKFKIIKDAGFDGVELITRSVKDRRALHQAQDATGLAVHGVSHSSDPDIAAGIDLAREFGGDGVLVTIPAPKSTESYLENYKTRQQIIRDAAPHAEKHRVKILVENVWASFLIEPLSMARFIDEIDHPWVGAYFDVGNNMRWGFPEHWIEVLGPRIGGKIHIKEFSTAQMMNDGLRHAFDVPLGEGSIDWEGVRDRLAKINFTGWATIEVRGGDVNHLTDLRQRLLKVLDLA